MSHWSWDVGAIQSSCYTCGVRHGLTLAISPTPQEEFRLVINQLVGSCRVKLIPEVWSIFRCLLPKVISNLLCTLYNLCIVFWYYLLFVAICEIRLIRLTYGAYLVLSLKLGITGESRSEDLKTPNALPRGKLGSYPFPLFKTVCLVNHVHTILKRK